MGHLAVLQITVSGVLDSPADFFEAIQQLSPTERPALLGVICLAVASESATRAPALPLFGTSWRRDSRPAMPRSQDAEHDCLRLGLQSPARSRSGTKSSTSGPSSSSTAASSPARRQRPRKSSPQPPHINVYAYYMHINLAYICVHMTLYTRMHVRLMWCSLRLERLHSRRTDS